MFDNGKLTLIEDVYMDKTGKINMILANYNVNEVEFIGISA